MGCIILVEVFEVVVQVLQGSLRQQSVQDSPGSLADVLAIDEVAFQGGGRSCRVRRSPFQGGVPGRACYRP